jgi:hypothetical protein
MHLKGKKKGSWVCMKPSSTLHRLQAVCSAYASQITHEANAVFVADIKQTEWSQNYLRVCGKEALTL